MLANFVSVIRTHVDRDFSSVTAMEKDGDDYRDEDI